LSSDTIGGIEFDYSLVGNMYSPFHSARSLIFALAVTVFLTCMCVAQEVASLDLTTVAARIDLRRPKATSPVKTKYSGIHSTTNLCHDSSPKAGALRTSLVSLDSTHYQVGDEPKFEVTVENVGSEPISIPFSPHLADLQPKNAARKFAYYQLQVTLWIASDADSNEQWSTNTGGDLTLYGGSDHAVTMLTLSPGEWVRVFGKGDLYLGQQLVELSRSGHPADHLYAKTSLSREELLITPTQSAGVGQEVCLDQTRGQAIPIELTIP
jgi:hypothetical protein